MPICDQANEHYCFNTWELQIPTQAEQDLKILRCVS